MTYLLHSRTEWSDDAVRPMQWLRTPTDTVIVHHSGGDGAFGANLAGQAGQAQFMRSLYSYGMNRDGAGCEYNDVVLCGADVWEGFGATVPGAHCVAIDPRTGRKASLSCYGICVWGNYMDRDAPAEMIGALVEHIRALRGRGVLHNGDLIIRGHKDYDPNTACPGRIYRLIASGELAARVNNQLPGGKNVNTLIRVKDSFAVFAADMDEQNIIHVARWIGPELNKKIGFQDDNVTPRVAGTKVVELGQIDMASISLVGPLPRGDKISWSVDNFYNGT